MISPERIETILKDCLYRKSELSQNQLEPPLDAVLVEGCINKFGLHPGRLESHRAEVAELLSYLPKGFTMTDGGGRSFLEACMDRDGHQWGEYIDIDRLVCLGIGLKIVQWCLPRDMWNVFPGGMPYFQVSYTGFDK